MFSVFDFVGKLARQRHELTLVHEEPVRSDLSSWDHRIERVDSASNVMTAEPVTYAIFVFDQKLVKWEKTDEKAKSFPAPATN